ncbi:MAG: GHMP kinase [Chloroflexi bacterium]|nr:GHMP kinase [Chloroflexota bacterium]
MLIARAPVRIGLAGGGTDLDAYYSRFGGLVVSVTIDKYFYVFLNVDGGDSVQISSSDYHTFYRYRGGAQPIWDGDLGLPRAVLHQFGVDRGLSMFLASEIPPGTGLGSSSTVAVAILKGLATLCDVQLTAQEVAELACTVEIDKLGMPIGKQDQYAAAFGGLNAFHFERERTVVTPLTLPEETLLRLEQMVLLFFTGSSRLSAVILRKQRESTQAGRSDVIEALHAIKRGAERMQRALERGSLDEVGAILDESWRHKKRLAKGISTSRIDYLYGKALSHGALGGKITGAGGGGFLMLICPVERRAAVSEALEAEGLYRMDFHLEFTGARVLMNASRKLPYRTSPWLSTGARTHG